MLKPAKRFIAFMISVGALFLGYLFGNAEAFNTFALTIGSLFGAFIAGQSATDYRESVTEAKIAVSK